MLPPDIPSFPTRAPRIATIGVATWRHTIFVDACPPAGDHALVRRESTGPGGISVIAALTTAALGASVSIRAIVGRDAAGDALRATLNASSVDTSWLSTADRCPTGAETVVVAEQTSDCAVFQRPGAHIVRGDRIDIAALFGHDVVLVDVDDPPLLRLLLDLPAHTVPSARLLGSLSRLVGAGMPDACDLVMRHDAVVGTERELMAITGASDLDHAISLIRRRMHGENLRAVVVVRGIEGSLAATIDGLWACPAFGTDVSGAEEAFIGATAFGMACRWDWGTVLRFATAVATLSMTGADGTPVRPTWNQAVALMAARQ